MIGESLRLLRIFNNYTTVELSEKVKVSQSYISEIENGKKQPTLQVIEKYANVFNMKPSTILLFSEALDEDSHNKSGKKQNVAYAGVKLLKLIERVGGLENE